jgi:hypothetical protein
MRNVIATDNVAIVGHDQEVFAKRLHTTGRLPRRFAAFKAITRDDRRDPRSPQRSRLEDAKARTLTGVTAWTRGEIWQRPRARSGRQIRARASLKK